MLSSGAKKDLLVLQFVNSLLSVSLHTEHDEDLKQRASNKHHEINKKIDRALVALQDELSKTISELYKIGGMETAEWVRKNLPKRIGTTLQKIQSEKINLEMLAMWIMYVNFAEAQRPLNPAMDKYRDAEKYFKITEMMTQTDIAELEEVLFTISYDIINQIKG